MANYATLKAAVQSVITTNGNNEITGAILQELLLSIINSLGAQYQFVGVATPSTAPGTPDYNVAYIAGPGTYSNFGSDIEIPIGFLGFFKYNGSWSKTLLNAGGALAIAMMGVYNSNTAAATATKVVSTTAAPDYVLTKGGVIHVKFKYPNTAASGVKLNINGQGAKDLYYDGKPVTPQNTWGENETVAIYYDGTNYYANTIETVAFTKLFVDTRQAIEIDGAYNLKTTLTENNGYTRPIYRFLAGHKYTIKITTTEAPGTTIVAELRENMSATLKTITKGATGTVFTTTYTPALDHDNVFIRFYSTYRSEFELSITCDWAVKIVADKATSDIVRIENLADITSLFDYLVVGGVDNANGFSAYNNSIFTKFYQVKEGDILRYQCPDGSGISSGYGLISFYNGIIPNKNTLITASTITSTGVSATIDMDVTIPAGVNWVGFAYLSSKSYTIKRYSAQENTTELNDISDHFFAQVDNKYLRSTGVWTDYSGMHTRFYRINPGDKIKVVRNRSDNDGSAGYNSLLLIKNNNLIQDNITAIVPSDVSIRQADQNFIFTVPDGYTILGCNFGTVPYTIMSNSKYHVSNATKDFELSRQEYIGLLNSKKRTNRNYSNLSLLHFSDLHGDAVNLARIVKCFDVYSKRIGINASEITLINDMIATGDQMASGITENFNWWANNGGSPILQVIGNHDAWTWDGDTHTTVSEQDCYNKFISPFLLDWPGIVQPSGAGANGYYPCYYYKDYSNANVRLVVLDCMHYNTDGTSTVTENVPGTQDTWFTNVLADAKANGLAVIVACHYPPEALTLMDVNFCSALYEQSDVINPAAVGRVQDFIDGGGEFVCWFGGHKHKDAFGYATNHPSQLCYLIETANCDLYNEGYVEHIDYTPTQDCFNILTVDTSKKWLKLLRIGNNMDLSLRHKGSICINYATKTVINEW